MFECFLGILLLVYFVAWINDKLNGNSSSSDGPRHSQAKPGEVFPNGYTRSDYHNKGFTDNDIATWGLDQNAAPRPDIARLMILDSLNDYLGKKTGQSDQGNDDLNIFRD